ncbi:MAG: hypothetical protein R3B95_07630 [Nitrospirales bacterium]|nr:hypothetical protein [Nitrospirales bacterium]
MSDERAASSPPHFTFLLRLKNMWTDSPTKRGTTEPPPQPCSAFWGDWDKATKTFTNGGTREIMRRMQRECLNALLQAGELNGPLHDPSHCTFSFRQAILRAFGGHDRATGQRNDGL